MYSRIETDAEATLECGSVFTPIATLANEAGGRAQIMLDDGCYVLCLKLSGRDTEDGSFINDGYREVHHIFPEAFEMLRTLPAPRKGILDGDLAGLAASALTA